MKTINTLKTMKDLKKAVKNGEFARVSYHIEHVRLQRCWMGKLEHVNNFLTCCLDNGLMSKTDSKNYKALCKRYYRWYNDGDSFSAILRKYSEFDYFYILSRREKILELETLLGLKEFLSKYLRFRHEYTNRIK